MPLLVAATSDYPTEGENRGLPAVRAVDQSASGTAAGDQSHSLVLPSKGVRPALLARHDSLHLTATSSIASPSELDDAAAKDRSASQGSSEGHDEALLFAGFHGSEFSGVDGCRMPSLHVVKMGQDDDDSSSIGAGARVTANADKRHGAKLHAPNWASCAPYGLSERITFVNDNYIRDTANGQYPVALHVYDLSSGLVGRHSKQLTGIEEEGVFHSAVTCYGMEFYFEGGIGMAPAGRTRFGAKFEVVPLGTTRKSYPAFLEWTRRREEGKYQLYDYHPVRHNCHHFSEDAARFLLDRDDDDDVIPQKLFTSTENLVRTDVGAAVLEALMITTFGIQHALARMLRARAVERQASQDKLINASAACGVLSLPPPAVIVFRVVDCEVCRNALEQITPFLMRVYASAANKREEALAVVTELFPCLLEGQGTVLEQHSTGFTDLMAQCLLHTPLAFWGPLLDCLRVAILNKTILATTMYNVDLLSLLLNACRDFPRLQPDGRLGLLRVWCNAGCSGVGAAVLIDQRYLGTIVATVGLALLDTANPMVVYTAACLASNLSLAIVASPSTSLKREMVDLGDSHPALRLATILVYNLSQRSAHLGEPSRNMVITATLRIMSLNIAALRFVTTAPFRLPYISLLRECTTNESRSCLCIMKTLEDLFA